ncbi:hypothetical protein ACFFK0_07510 [Paenibacillus chartarius]|uniref:Phosphoribosyltransferase n=1 Tax=Paenibacillus chartarius TaxID=747481 RepID=A0ABV6DI66_9BACL
MESIFLRLDALSETIKQARFDALVIILRGGSFAGVHMAFLTGLPLFFLKYDRPTRNVIPVGPLPPPNARLLISEDFAGSGKTLIDCKAYLEREGYKCSTLVVVRDQLSASIPDYCCFYLQETDARFILPWERAEINPDTVLHSGTYMDPEYEHTAWDLDGVFLRDVDSAQYRDNLEEALMLRDSMAPAAFAPKVRNGDIIITGRPSLDRERTIRWLQKHNFNIPIVFRDDDIETPTAESTARWKGNRAVELGFTHFVESEAEQAVHMASMYPELRVTWWNEGKPIMLQASELARARNKVQNTGNVYDDISLTPTGRL